MKRFLVLLVFVLGCATATPPPAEPVHVIIVGTTDVHGWFNGRVEVPKEGGEGVAFGGLPLLASYVQALRAENGGRVLVVDSGDMFQGTLESNLFEGEPVIRAYNAIGYTAAAVGNHEFDFGPIGPDVAGDQPGEDPVGALKRNAGIARFPFLSANMVERSTGKPPQWVKPSIIVNAGAARVGIIGLSLEDTPNVTMEINVRALQFTDAVEATIREATALRQAGADAVIVIAHNGGRCRDMNDENNIGSCEPDHGGMRYLRALPPGTIDAFFGGHTHSQMRQIVNGVPALQALAYSQEFSAIDLWVDPAANRVIPEKTSLRPHTMICRVVYSGTDRCDARNAPAGATLVPRVFSGKTIEPDARVREVINPYLDRVAAKRNQKLGITTTAPFTRTAIRESSLGNFVADSLRHWAGADIALMNSGGIRANLRAGDLVYSDIFEVSPFDNYPAVVMMTGQQVIDALRATSGGGRGILQVSGIKYVIDESRDADKPPEQRDRLVSATLENGEPLVLDKLYKVVMPDFLVQGGDAMAGPMKGVPRELVTVHQDRPLRDVVIESLQKRGGPFSPKTDGRITVINPRPNVRPD